VRAQLPGGRRRSGEAEKVLLGQVVEQARRAAADQLHRAVGQETGLDDQLDQPGGQVRGLGGRLDQRGHARDQRRGELLQWAPDREVEGVDLDGDAEQRSEHVLAGELAAAAERLDRALGVERVVGQLTAGLAGVAEKNADAAVHVELRVAQGGAGPRRKAVQLTSVLPQHGADGLDERGPLVEGQHPQRGAAGGAAVLERGGEIDAVRGDPGDLLAGDRVAHRAPVGR
jgi:hypothetical protein